MEKDIVKKLQEEAKNFITQNILVLKNFKIKIYPKEIEVYYYNDDFKDKAVHRKPQQTMKYKDHFYVHRCKNSDSYKGGNRAGLDFVVSDDENTYYSYLIRSAVINGQPFYGPNNVLNAIKSACGYVENADLEKQLVDTVSSDVKYNDIIYTTRIGLSDNVDAYFRGCALRLVALDKDFKNARYKAKEQIVLDYLKQSKSTKIQAETFCKDNLTYLPSKIIEYYDNKN
jgi:hypothetical protein